MACFSFLFRKKKRCKYCNNKLLYNIDNNSFCNKNCETFYLYQDSFRSSDSSLHKYILNLEV